MIRFQADADLHQRIVWAVRRQEPAIDFATAAEGSIEGLTDSEVLEIAAAADRILITYDRRTMVDHFRTRLRSGKSSPGVLLLSQFAPLGQVVEAIVLAWAASGPSEWRDRIVHLPSLSRHVFTR